MRDRRRPPSTAGAPAGLSRLALAAVACLLSGLAGAAGPASAPAPVLHLTSGGFVPGELLDAGKPGLIRWHGTPFASPFDFDANAVNVVHFPSPAEPPKTEGAFCFDLTGGDVLFGGLVSLGDDDAVLEIPKLGRVQVKRSRLIRITRWRGGSDLVYTGPAGMNGWTETTPGTLKGWREESGELVSKVDGTSIRGDLGIPARALVEFELSWKSKPDFSLALGVGDDEISARHAFRFEVWEDYLVACRETDAEADVSALSPVEPEPGRAHLLAYLDQDQGRLIVVSADGKRLADLKVADRKPKALGGLRLENKRGDVRLERVRVTRWDGEPPPEGDGAKAGLRRVGGAAVKGRVAGYDAASKEFLVDDGGKQTRVPRDDVASVTLSTPVGKELERGYRVDSHDGTRLGGELEKVEKGELVLTVPGFKDAVRLPVAGLRSLVVLRHGETTPGKTPGRAISAVRLSMEGVVLPGRLTEAEERPGASCLAWLPDGAAAGSPLRPGVSGTIIYKEPKPPVVRSAQGVLPGFRPQPPAQPAGGVGGFLRGFAGGQAPDRSHERRSLHLRTGDIIPSEVTKIDETGVSFKTPLSESTFVPHEKIKAVELTADPAATIRLSKSKRERLLTLPRMQKGSPPTHLIRSRNGDYLRGRVVKMDDKTIQVETRLETKDLPRERVSRIIWLHADETDPPKDPAAEAARKATTRVQVVRSDGTRLTFFPERFAAATLSGKSDVLGVCRVRIDQVDQLLIGGAIEQEAARLAYQQWKLQNAPEPKVVQNEDGTTSSGRAPGTESALVGKPAPDFTLDLLAGKPFHLAGRKGKVVVLDFWATWCGPCLQAMPQVDKVTREFREQGVELVAVNLQEAPKEITSMLERHKLEMTVALDRDGVVAEKYGANAIPQTVIIDREGNVARLYVGGGPHLGDQLRDALKAVLQPVDPKEPKKTP